MSHTNVTQLSHACQQAQEWVGQLASMPPFEVEEQAYAYLRSVLHTLRDRLTVEEAVHLAAQLPVLIRGIYYEGWKPARVPQRIRTLREFYHRVEEGFGGTLSGSGVDTPTATHAVLAFLEAQIDPGEMRHVRGQLPRELQSLFASEAA